MKLTREQALSCITETKDGFEVNLATMCALLNIPPTERNQTVMLEHVKLSMAADPGLKKLPVVLEQRL